MRIPSRWLILLVVTLASVLNYLDRQILPALAATIRLEFGLSNADYGWLLSAFSIAYAISAPLAGWTIDRVGLSRGICLVVALWSLAGMGTGLAGTFAGLLVLRATLGVAQAGGVPASSKAIALYLPAQERAVGMATTQVGLSTGAILAPLVASSMAAEWGWRASFLASGMLGFVWIPLWLSARRRVPPVEQPVRTSTDSASTVVRDRRLWGLILCTILYMTLYSLWSNWTTLYLVEARGLTEQAANRTLAWMPPLFANLGGLFGGWLALHWIRHERTSGREVIRARMRINWLSATISLLATAAVPLTSSTAFATALICLSFFWITAMSVNVYAMPLDIFGPKHAALAVSTLTGAYGLMQTFVSPLIGSLVDHYGFGLVCIGGAMAPLAGVSVLETMTARAPENR